MTPVTDEQLAAFLDGAMDEAEAAAFEARLAADAELAARAERWLGNDRRIVAALLPLAETPVDAGLLAHLGLGDGPAAPSAMVAANDNPRWWRRHALPLGGALAACLAVVAMVGLHNNAAPPHDLSFALETGASLHPIKLADGTKVTPTLTVRAADGRWCREFRSGASAGLACRDSGHWRVEARGKGGGPAQSGEIAVAAGADGSALDTAYSRLGASDPVDAGAEAALIAGGWQK